MGASCAKSPLVWRFEGARIYEVVERYNDEWKDHQPMRKRMIQIYMDGGAREAPGPEKNFDLSWGIVALFEDFHVESSGAWMNAPRRFGGAHEEIALAQAVRLAASLGFGAGDIGFFTDDLNACHAGGWLHPENYRPAQAAAVTERYRSLCDHFYDEALFERVMECLRVSRFTKVKGHARVVYNLRADYLAGMAREPGSRPLPYDDWLHGGLSESSGPDNWAPWQPPFTSPELGPAGRLESMFRLALRAAEPLAQSATGLSLIEPSHAAGKPAPKSRRLIRKRLFGAKGRG